MAIKFYTSVNTAQECVNQKLIEIKDNQHDCFNKVPWKIKENIDNAVIWLDYKYK